MPNPETTVGSRRELRPGPGWRRLGGAVWEHPSGVCIHVAGLCCFRGVTIINGREWPESRELDRAIQVNGGNRKRGTMVWAMARRRCDMRQNETERLRLERDDLALLLRRALNRMKRYEMDVEDELPHSHRTFMEQAWMFLKELRTGSE